MKRQIITVLFIVCLFATSFLSLTTADNTNLAIIPTNWRIGESWAAPSYLDTSVLHNGNNSVRIEKGTEDKSREVDGADFTQPDWAIPISPGDHVFFSVWMKTSVSTIDDVTPTSGIRLGIDYYHGEGGYITGIQNPSGTPPYLVGETLTFPADSYLNFVNWGSDWEQRTMEFIVPDEVMSNGAFGYILGEMVVPDRIVPWIQVWSNNYGNLDGGIGWFADTILYINPLDETPLVAPTFSSLTLSDTSVLTDEPISCSVTLTGGSGDPTGTVTFYTADEDAIVWNQLGLPVTLAAASATSINFYAGLAGNYLFKAEYSGDGVYTAYSSANTWLTVNNPVVVAAPAMLGLLGAVFTRAEQQNVGDSYWVRGGWMDGMWEFNTPMQNVVRQAEKVDVGDSYWDRGLWDDGMWEHDTPFINLRKEMEKH
jgi:hypothetical protein